MQRRSWLALMAGALLSLGAGCGAAAAMAPGAGFGAGPGVRLGAETDGCVTQAGMGAAQRSALSAAAYGLAGAVLADDPNEVQRHATPQVAGDFGALADLVQSTSREIAGDTLTVTQAYLLEDDGPAGGESVFACPLHGVGGETDLDISGLLPGRYAFVLVEAAGPRPWALPLLLQAASPNPATLNPAGAGISGSAPELWQLAGFFPHTRMAAGHNGLWYWTEARVEAQAGHTWLAWLFYGEADQLLRPANFVTTTHLDRLRAERQAFAPPALGEGVGPSKPMSLQGADGAVYQVTGVNAAASADARQLNLVLHLRQTGGEDQTRRNVAAAAALLAAYPELRSAFSHIWVVADDPGSEPVLTEQSLTAVR